MGSFIDRVKEETAVIGVIGQSYVGLPLALVRG
jgi:UDP-N-acetyl-D-mannosaminuronate dehydrogenase